MAELENGGEEDREHGIDNNHHANLSVEEKAARLYKGEALAPMVRASTTPLRTLALSYGADLCYTEELMDRSLTGTTRFVNSELQTIDYIKDVSKMAAKQQRKLLQDGGPALYLRMDQKLERNRLVCQIGSGEADLAVAAALHVYEDVGAIDINMGCPKKFSVSGGMGSALLSDVDRACRIVRAVSDHVSSSNSRNPIPVSAKIRLLKDTQSTLDFITALINRGGAKAVAIHGRRVGDAEVQSANWDELERVVTLATSKFPGTPILINGDFYTRTEFTDFMRKTGAAGVLLARPALYNTSIFRKPTALSASTTEHDSSHEYGYSSPLLLDKTTVIQDYLKEAIKYEAHYKNVKYVVCEMMNSRRAPHPRTPFLPQVFRPGQTIGTTCACSNLPDICQIWDINYQAEQAGWRRRRGLSVTDTTPHKSAMMAGEHKYLDSYLLQFAAPAATPERTAADASGNDPASVVSSKRPRIDGST
jgi:tRNA-dihydrouridine synthase 2